MEQVSIVVSERAGDWAGWVDGLRSQTDTLIVLVQDVDEKPSSFAKRVFERLTRMQASGARLSRGVYVPGTCADGDTLRQRTKIMRKLSARLAAAGAGGRLFLDPATPEHRPAPTWIRALAMTLRDMAGGSGLSISVGPSAAFG